MSAKHDRDPFRVCRGCGCTDDRGCPGGCSWILMDFAITKKGIVPAPTGICSACAIEMDFEMKMMVDAICEYAAAVYSEFLFGLPQRAGTAILTVPP
jgi:hypothetical protein